MKARIGLRVDGRTDDELSRLSEEYGVSKPFVLLLAYRLCDRSLLRDVLKLKRAGEEG